MTTHPPEPTSWSPPPYPKRPPRWTDLAFALLMSPYGVLLALAVAVGAYALVDAVRSHVPRPMPTETASVSATVAGGGVSASDTDDGGAWTAEPAALWLDSDPAGASVWVDGDSMGVTPALVRALPAGTVDVTFRTARGQLDTLLVLTAGEARRLAVDLPGASSRRRPRRARATEAQEPQPVPGARPRAPRRPEESRSGTPRAATESRTEPQRAQAGSWGRASLRLSSDPAGAEVTVDGRTVGTTPLVVSDLAPGQHDVAVSASGYGTARARPTLSAGQQTALALDLEARMGFLTVEAPPGSTIKIDGQPRVVGSGALYRTDLLPGTHRVSVTAPGDAPVERVLEVSAGVTLTFTVQQRP